jgi:hypothetical protein
LGLRRPVAKFPFYCHQMASPFWIAYRSARFLSTGAPRRQTEPRKPCKPKKNLGYTTSSSRTVLLPHLATMQQTSEGLFRQKILHPENPPGIARGVLIFAISYLQSELQPFGWSGANLKRDGKANRGRRGLRRLSQNFDQKNER